MKCAVLVARDAVLTGAAAEIHAVPEGKAGSIVLVVSEVLAALSF